jgi:Origin recognition complex (ORC) subunit 3 N-terminus
MLTGFLLLLFLRVDSWWVLIIGNNVAGHTRLFAQIQEQLRNVMDGPVIVVSATEVGNLQSLLKRIVAGCLKIEVDEIENEENINVALSIENQADG